MMNVCASNPCNHGICIEGLTSFICDCLPSWTGRTCNGNRFYKKNFLDLEK